MRGMCIVQNCTIGACNPGHTLPKDIEKLKRWLDAVKNSCLCELPIEILCTKWMICSKHFDEDSFIEFRSKSKRLKDSAMPTLHLPVSEEQEVVEMACTPENEIVVEENCNHYFFYSNDINLPTEFFDGSQKDNFVLSNNVPLISPPNIFHIL